MKNNLLKNLILLSVSTLVFVSCTKDDDSTEKPTPGAFENGIFISNEGPFQTGSGTISFYNRTTNSVVQTIFENVNNFPLGNIVQSIEIFENRAFIVVNNSSKVEIVEANTFLSLGVINGFTSPRYFCEISSEKAYFTDWANNVAVVNIVDNTIVKTIPTGKGPEKMLKTGDKVYVLNQGGWGIDSTITVMDYQVDTVLTTITVAPKPNGIVLDKNGKIWVICSGNGWNGVPGPDDSEGHLICIDPANNTIIQDIVFNSVEKHPEKLTINTAGDKLYYNYPDGIYEFDISNNSLNTSAFIPRGSIFYSLGFDPVDSYIYASDPVDYQQDGWVHRYNASTGIAIDSFKVGVIPGDFCFN